MGCFVHCRLYTGQCPPQGTSLEISLASLALPCSLPSSSPSLHCSSLPRSLPPSLASSIHSFPRSVPASLSPSLPPSLPSLPPSLPPLPPSLLPPSLPPSLFAPAAAVISVLYCYLQRTRLPATNPFLTKSKTNPRSTRATNTTKFTRSTLVPFSGYRRRLPQPFESQLRASFPSFGQLLRCAHTRLVI